MINFENVFPILLWSALGFLILKAIMVSIMASWVDWGAATWIGWGSAIVGAILVVALYFRGSWLSENTAASLAFFFGLYIPASIAFARKYGAVLGIYKGGYFEGSRPIAYPLGASKVLLVMLLLVIASLAKSTPAIGWIIVAFLVMTAAALVGTYRYEDTRFGLWINNLEVKEVEGAISYSTKERSSKKSQGSRIADISIWALDRIGVAMSYLGLPILLTLMLPEPSLWAWGGCALCLVGFLTPPIYFWAKRTSFLRGIKREYVKLKQAEASGDLQTIVAALVHPHIGESALWALNKQFTANPSISDGLLQTLIDRQRNKKLVDFLWHWVAGGGIYNQRKFDPIFAKRLAEALFDIPIDQGTLLLNNI